MLIVSKPSVRIAYGQGTSKIYPSGKTNERVKDPGILNSDSKGRKSHDLITVGWLHNDDDNNNNDNVVKPG